MRARWARRGQTRIEDYEARVTPGGVVADDIAVWQPDPDGRGSRGACPLPVRGAAPADGPPEQRV